MKESKKVRDAMEICDGKMARLYGYRLLENKIVVYGTEFPISKQVYKRLIELHY